MELKKDIGIENIGNFNFNILIKIPEEFTQVWSRMKEENLMIFIEQKLNYGNLGLIYDKLEIIHWF